MKRAGFTMIELIFVIVILGILSAVALPKFIGVSEQAEAGKCKAFVGILNRTVGPALWSDSLLNGGKGKIGSTDGTASTSTVINGLIAAQLEIPSECEFATANTSYGTNGSVTIGGKVYDANFTDGTETSAAVWGWKKH